MKQDQFIIATVRKDLAKPLCKVLNAQFSRDFTFETEPEAIGATIFTPALDPYSGKLTPSLKHHIRFYIKGILAGVYIAIHYNITK